MKQAMRYVSVITLLICSLLSGLSLAESVVVGDQMTEQQLEEFRRAVEQAYPDMNLVDIRGDWQAELVPPPPPPPRPATVAVFVRNQTGRRDLDEEMDAMRSMFAAEMSGLDLTVIDYADLMDRFRQNRIPGDPDLREMIRGLTPGGTAVRLADMIEADYLIQLSLTSADVRSNTIAGNTIDTWTLRGAVRVMEGDRGGSIHGANIERRHPRRGGTTSDDSIYFRDLISQIVPEAAQSVVASRPSWPQVARTRQFVTFTVRTNLDTFIDGLEQGVRGPNELLDEVRRLVGGTTVLLNGAGIGSTPGTFRAAAGLHNLRVEREWMRPYDTTVMISEGMELNVALELSDAGIARFATLEGVKAGLALQYAEAAWRKGIKIDFSTGAWNDVTIGATDRSPGGVNIIQMQQ